MARIYYNEEKIQGKPFESKIINVQVFDYILNNTNKYAFKIKEKQTVFLKFFKKSKTIFSKSLISSGDGVHYNTTEGDFYLPNSIIFYDVDDYSFPSKFYFIAKIKNQLELRQCMGGEDVKWYQIPNLHTELTDESIIEKINNTIIKITELIDTKSLPSESFSNIIKIRCYPL